MGILQSISNFILPVEQSLERKSQEQVFTLPGQASPDEVRRNIARDQFGGPLAVQISAVFSCARVIAEGLSQVPCLLQRSSATGGRELAVDHPLYDLLSRAPNDFQNAFEFREWLGFRLALTGNAFVYVARDDLGRAIELIPLAQQSVSVSNPKFGEVVYRLNIPGSPIVVGNDNIWHLRGPSWDGITGWNPQSYAARAIGLSSDLQEFGEKLFQNGTRPSGLLTTDQTLTAEQLAVLKQALTEEFSGVGNAHKAMVMANGLEWQSTQTTADDAQFIESRRFQIEEVCRFMRVDPLMIGQATNSAAYASIEQRFLAHMTHCMGPWYARFEQSAERNLLTLTERRKGYRIHLDNRSMLRGNAKDRADYLAVMKQNGFMTTNECRDFEGLDRIPDAAADLLTPAANLYGPTNEQTPPAE